jgi:antitoxin HicB
MTLRYPVKLEADDNGTVLATCPSLPEVTTFGEDDADALAHAVGAIEEALAARITDGEGHPGATRAAARPVGGAAADDVT